MTKPNLDSLPVNVTEIGNNHVEFWFLEQYGKALSPASKSLPTVLFPWRWGMGHMPQSEPGKQDLGRITRTT